MTSELKFNTAQGGNGVDTLQFKYDDTNISKLTFSSSGDIAFHTVNSGNNALFLKSNGNVGIGTTNPTAKFHVSGDAKIESLTVTSVTNTSDRRLKVNIKALEKHTIEDLRPVEYNWRKIKGKVVPDNRCYGFIAQELRTIYPNMIKTNERGLLSVDYIQLIPVSIRNIQILEGRIDELTREIAELRLKIEAKNI
tara:strand:- start:662 stop:1246 length:585 start_codon:yes stop_codon:yes gene_type:complete